MHLIHPSSVQHSYIANGLGGKNGSIVVDLRELREIQVDSTTGLAHIGTGNRLGDIALAIGANGRGLPHGTCPYVGIGGHAGQSYSLDMILYVRRSSEAKLAHGSLRRICVHIAHVGLDVRQYRKSGHCPG